MEPNGVIFSIAITLCDQHLPHNDTLQLARCQALRGQSFFPKEVSSQENVNTDHF